MVRFSKYKFWNFSIYSWECNLVRTISISVLLLFTPPCWLAWCPTALSPWARWTQPPADAGDILQPLQGEKAEETWTLFGFVKVKVIYAVWLHALLSALGVVCHDYFSMLIKVPRQQSLSFRDLTVTFNYSSVNQWELFSTFQLFFKLVKTQILLSLKWGRDEFQSKDMTFKCLSLLNQVCEI